MDNNQPKIKVVFFDVAGTLIKEKSWVFLMIGLGLMKEYNSLIVGLKHGKYGQVELNQKLKILLIKRGVTRQDLEKIWSNFSWKPGGNKITNWLQEKGVKVFLISGASDILVKKVADDLRVDGWRAATCFVFDRQGAMIDMLRTKDQARWKVKQVEEIMKKNAWKKEEGVFVGDGWNDVRVFEYLTKGITFDYGNSTLKKRAWRVVTNLEQVGKIIEKRL